TAVFDQAASGSTAAGRGGGYGFANGFDRRIGDWATLGFGMVRQMSEHRLDGQFGSGHNESTLLAVQGTTALPYGAQLQAVAAVGSGRFDGARAVVSAGSSGAANITQAASYLALAANVVLPLSSDSRVPVLTAGFDWRRVTAGGYTEAAGDLGLIVDRGVAQRTEMRLGLGWTQQQQLGASGYRLTANVATGWVHRLSGPAERVTARFANLPELAFDLTGVLPPADALALDVGAALVGPGGFWLGASATGRLGDTLHERVARISVGVNF
ncbi:MAG: autotransporter outer membrane beta-barrel domain-containing protein, partial [Polymorphobacter sp.]